MDGWLGDTCNKKNDGSKGAPFKGDLKERQLLTPDEVKVGKTNGIFWFKPEKEDAATQSFIDMEFDDGDGVGGWVLAGYGHITPSSGSTFNIPNLNFPNGYKWKYVHACCALHAEYLHPLVVYAGYVPLFAQN